MSQVFHRSTNTISKVSIFGAVFILAGLGWVVDTISRSSYVTQAQVARVQPVPFSHKHHVGGEGFDCRYCHTSVEKSAYAGIPPTKVCMNCHSQLWAQSPMLEQVRESFKTGRSLSWTRVNDLPQFAYFNHSIHIAKGVGCSTCHGRVDEMPLTSQQASLQMGWCLNCHRNPAQFVRPRSEVFNMAWEPPPDQLEQGAKLVKEYDIMPTKVLTSCSTCHR
jgi:Cytochrome c7 and related cytochrome c